jgi:methionyl-tRNA formyltransferase
MNESPPLRESDKDRNPLRIVFMGTPALAARILGRLVKASGEDFQVVGVVTRADRLKGRGLKLEPSEVGALATRLGLPTLKPEKIRTVEFHQLLVNLRPDVLAVAAYGRILPLSILEVPRRIPLNVHASLLPKFRGASPIEGAILAGDSQTGVTIMRIVEPMDAGPMLLQREIPIDPADTQTTLKDKLAELGAAALVEVLSRVGQGDLSETPQDESRATYTAIIKKEDAIIDWNRDAVYIERMTRAYQPWPIARTKLGRHDLLIYRARTVESDTAAVPPSTIVSISPATTVQCGRGRLELIEVQAAGRRRMSAADLMRGRRIEVGAQLG